MNTFTTHNTIYTPSLSSRKLPLSCSEIGHILLTSFSKPSADARYLVSLVLQSAHDYFEHEDKPLIDDKNLKAVACLSDLLMALASRLEVDLKNQAWTGNVLADVRTMYNRIIFKLTNFLLDTTVGDPRSVVIAMRSTLEIARHNLLVSNTQTIQRGIASTARKYRILYTRTATIEDDEYEMPQGPQGPMVCEGLLVRMRVGLKSALKKKWGKKGAEREAEREEADVMEADVAEADVAEKPEDEVHTQTECVGSLVSGDEDVADSGVSMGGSSEDECDEWVWDNGEVAVAF